MSTSRAPSKVSTRQRTSTHTAPIPARKLPAGSSASSSSHRPSTPTLLKQQSNLHHSPRLVLSPVLKNPFSKPLSGRGQTSSANSSFSNGSGNSTPVSNAAGSSSKVIATPKLILVGRKKVVEEEQENDVSTPVLSTETIKTPCLKLEGNRKSTLLSSIPTTPALRITPRNVATPSLLKQVASASQTPAADSSVADDGHTHPMHYYMSKPDEVDTPTWTMFLQQAYPEETKTIDIKIPSKTLREKSVSLAEDTPASVQEQLREVIKTPRIVSTPVLSKDKVKITELSSAFSLITLQKAIHSPLRQTSFIATPKLELPSATPDAKSNLPATPVLTSKTTTLNISSKSLKVSSNDDVLEVAMRRLSLSCKKRTGRASGNSLLNSPATWYKNKKASRGNSSGSASASSTIQVDRFIANRLDIQSSQFQLTRDDTQSLTNPLTTGTVSSVASQNNTQSFTKSIDSKSLDMSELLYQTEVAKACGVAIDQRILQFKNRISTGKTSTTVDKEQLRAKYNRPLRQQKTGTHARRKIATVPERILDAPGILDDYYSNLLDWSSKNMLAVSLGPSIYVWNGQTGETFELFTTNDEVDVSSVSWSADGSHLAVGDFNGKTHLINLERQMRVRTMNPDASLLNADDQPRVGSLAWNRGILSTGLSTGTIHNHDVRVRSSRVDSLQGHYGVVCGLKWSPDGGMLASGGNDNLVNVWDARASQRAKWTMDDHRGAVKALSWCPWQPGLLASGGGMDDQKIRFWNTSNGHCTGVIETGSQVTSIQWSKTYKELISSHGFAQNQLIIWKYPTLTKVMELPNAHESRILYSTLSPDGQTICTGAADENIKFWKVFAFDPKSVKVKRGKRVDVFGNHTISSSTGPTDASTTQHSSPDFGVNDYR